MCLKKEEEEKKAMQSSQHDGAVAWLLFLGITSVQLARRTRTFFFALRYPLQFLVGAWAGNLVFHTHKFLDKANGCRVR